MSWIIWYASVATSGSIVFRVLSVRKKKKLATRMPRRMHRSATDWQIADFPAPAAPFSHAIHASRGASSRIQSKISSRTASRVCGWQRGGSTRCLELWKAAGDTWSRRVWNPSFGAVMSAGQCVSCHNIMNCAYMSLG